MGYFLDSHDPAKWYIKGFYNAINGDSRFKLFAFIPGTKRIKDAYNKGYNDANRGVVDIEYLREKTTSERILEVVKNIKSSEVSGELVRQLVEIAYD